MRGAVEQNATMTIDLAAHAHPASGITPVGLGAGARGTASASGENVAYAAGATPGSNDTFTAKITAGGVASRIATVTIDVGGRDRIHLPGEVVRRSPGPGGPAATRQPYGQHPLRRRDKTWVRTLGPRGGSPSDLDDPRSAGRTGAAGPAARSGATKTSPSRGCRPATSATRRRCSLGVQATCNNFLVEGLRVHNWWDELVLTFQNNAANCTLRGCWFSHMRDDNIENDNKRDGLLVDDCPFTARTWGSAVAITEEFRRRLHPDRPRYPSTVAADVRPRREPEPGPWVHVQAQRHRASATTCSTTSSPGSRAPRCRSARGASVWARQDGFGDRFDRLVRPCRLRHLSKELPLHKYLGARFVERQATDPRQRQPADFPYHGRS